MSEAVDTQSDYELELGWMDRTGPWGTRAEPGKYGLTLADIQLGEYGEAPEESANQTGRPRGAAARPSTYRIGAYGVRSKNEIWLDTASFLYEEALQRQWSSATDVPWPASSRRHWPARACGTRPCGATRPSPGRAALAEVRRNPAW